MIQYVSNLTFESEEIYRNTLKQTNIAIDYDRQWAI